MVLEDVAEVNVDVNSETTEALSETTTSEEGTHTVPEETINTVPEGAHTSPEKAIKCAEDTVVVQLIRGKPPTLALTPKRGRNPIILTFPFSP
jgi:hypothetical protein